MIPRQTISELFSTFLQFEGNTFQCWATDPRLLRSIRRHIESLGQQKLSDSFWVTYWYKKWMKRPDYIAEAHLFAYLQEACYWSGHKALKNYAHLPYTLSDYCQLAGMNIKKVLQTYKPERNSNIKLYAVTVLLRAIRDLLRQRKETDNCTPWALLRKISKKRFTEALARTGLGPEIIAQYCLAWSCFNQQYIVKQANGSSQLPKPDPATWQAITQLYNAQRQHQMIALGLDGTPKMIEEWLVQCAQWVRDYLYPNMVSLNQPKSGAPPTQWQDDLPAEDLDEPLTALIAIEQLEERNQQRAQLTTVLTTALDHLSPKIQTMLSLYYGHSLTQQQIAQKLEIKQYSVSRSLTKARTTLLNEVVQWSQTSLHISPNSNLIINSGAIIDDWLKCHYQVEETNQYASQYENV